MTNDYKYAGTPLTSTIAAELTLEFFSGKTVERIEITETVVHVHSKQGGLPAKREADQVIKTALQGLKKKGVAVNIIVSVGFWRIAVDPPPAYKFADCPLVVTIASELILEQYAGQTIEKVSIMQSIIDLHCERGGFPPRQQPKDLFKASLRRLKKKELAEVVGKGIWRIGSASVSTEQTQQIKSKASVSNSAKPTTTESISHKVIGKGNESVYLYYYPSNKKLAGYEGRPTWNCKIGATEDDPLQRVKSQTGDYGEAPYLALIIKTPNAKVMEKLIHGYLNLHSRQIETERSGKEWFITNPTEVSKIHAHIIRFKY